jgi:hypothetical protein
MKWRRRLSALSVRRWGEDDPAPIVLDDRDACSDTWSGHHAKGCIGMTVRLASGGEAFVHMTSDEALNLSDLLRAMVEADR